MPLYSSEMLACGFLVVSLSGLDGKVTFLRLTSENEFGSILSFSVFWKSLRRIGINSSLNVWKTFKVCDAIWPKAFLLLLGSF